MFYQNLKNKMLLRGVLHSAGRRGNLIFYPENRTTNFTNYTD